MEFNSYGSRRGNHEIMLRGTFANVRIKNLMVPPFKDGSPVEGGYTLIQPKGRFVDNLRCKLLLSGRKNPLHCFRRR